MFVGNFFLPVILRSDIFAYKDQMRRQNAECKMKTLSLLAKLYQTQQELDRVCSFFVIFYEGLNCAKVQKINFFKILKF